MTSVVASLVLSGLSPEVRRTLHPGGILVTRELSNGDSVILTKDGRRFLVAKHQPDYVYDDFVVHAGNTIVVGLSRNTRNYRIFAMTGGSEFRPLSPNIQEVVVSGGIDAQEDAWEPPVQHNGVIAGVLFRGSTRNDRYVYRISEAGLELGMWPSAAQVILDKDELTVVAMDGTKSPLESKKLVWTAPLAQRTGAE